MFLSKKSIGLGIDISDFSIKIIGIEKRKNGLFLSFANKSEIPTGIVEAGQIKKEKELSAIVKKTIQGAGEKAAKVKKATASLPEEKSFLDILTLPAAEDKELVNLVKFEAANHIPVPIDDVYFDFEKIETGQVLFAASPKKLVEAYSRTLQMAGLKPDALEGEALALARALTKKKVYYKPMLIVDFGQSQTTFLAYSGNSLKFTSTVPLSSTDFTKALQERLKINTKQAEKLKLVQGLSANRPAPRFLPYLTI